MQRHLLSRAMTLAALPYAALSAQDAGQGGRPVTSPSGRAAVACTGQRVDQIIIYAEAPSVDKLRRVPVVARMARTLHVTTNPAVIRRFILMDEGEPCSELRRAESERILRAQPFIADADLFVVAGDAGGVDLEVRTSDEASIVFGGGVRSRAPMVTSFLLGNANLGGEGIYTSFAWRYGDGFRDGVAAKLIDHQFLGRAWVFGLEGERARIGGSWRIEGTRPFLTDLQRLAWRVRSGQSSGYTELRMPNGARPTVAVARNFFDVGGIARVGPPGRLTLIGLSFTGDDERPGDRLLTADQGVLRDLGPVPIPYSPHRIARGNLLLGLRDITFARRDGLDALTATQDVPVGFQLGTQWGRSMGVLGAKEEDFFLAGNLYVGAVSRLGVLRFQAQGEGRRGSDASEWDGVLTTARLTHYLRVAPAQMNVVSVEFSNGYRQRTPFQLYLGVPDGGVRGYEQSSFAGGQRLVVRAEHRYVMGRVLDVGDAGLAVFADAGRQWAGDVPFGVTTPVKSSIGLSVMAAVPSRSARLWRLDLAVPLGSGANRGYTLKFTNADRTQFVFREPRDVSAGRELTVPSSIFAWP